MCRPSSKSADKAGGSAAAVSQSDSSSESESTPTAAAPAYPSDSSTAAGGQPTVGILPPQPPQPLPGDPKRVHAEYQQPMQQRHRDRVKLHKDQVGCMLCMWTSCALKAGTSRFQHVTILVMPCCSLKIILCLLHDDLPAWSQQEYAPNTCHM